MKPSRAFSTAASGRLSASWSRSRAAKRDDRPKLAEALALCRVHNATLCIAKLDRLSRDAHFLLGLQKAGVQFVAADMPEANELTIGLLVVVAQHERQMISKRTKEALAAAKTHGTKLGGTRWDQLAGEVGQRGREAALVKRRNAATARSADFAAVLVIFGLPVPRPFVRSPLA